MENDSKYYTPTIEEFYVGFEYEVKKEESWFRCFYSQGSLVDIYYKYNDDLDSIDFEADTIRVKYLDQEDIESLGFITYDDTTFDKGDLQIRFNCLLQKKGQGLGLIIYDGYSGIIFTGYIKNKSELVKLFKQLDINE
jgi:hypothetical protein